MQIDEVKTYENGFKILWSDEKIGFGEISFDGKELDSECMSDAFCKEIFALFIKKYLKNV